MQQHHPRHLAPCALQACAGARTHIHMPLSVHLRPHPRPTPASTPVPAPQCRDLELGVDVVVGTPGRVIDLIERQKLVLSKVRVHVWGGVGCR